MKKKIKDHVLHRNAGQTNIKTDRQTDRERNSSKTW